ncbi:SGNH/GDSL hydrolase family protein [Actinoplanes sp. NPDC051411]|uniref:SGNH/GDSL hydrolase family protein n=1 Tax=Actinoplanes sp. NPDC051411 TaxID=3155522 RepID=UPI00342921E8
MDPKSVRRAAAGLLIAALAGCGTLPSAAAAPAPSPAAEPVVVTLGDSVPAGSACDCDPFPVTYARTVHAVSENLAVPGYTSADVLTQIPGVRSRLATADEVVLMIGANDLAAAFDADTSFADAATTMRQNVTAAIRAIDAVRATRVLVLGYWNVVQDGRVAAAAYGPAGVQRSVTATEYANDGLREAAADTHATYISTDAAFHGPDGTQDPSNLLAADGDHPNAAGHAAIAALLPPLRSGD